MRASGTVSGNTKPNADVVLVPDATPRGSYDLSYRTLADQYGYFEIQNIAPGNYRLYAWQELDEFDIEVLKPYVDQSVPIRIDSNSRLSVAIATVSIP
jgi:hypothetical protein